MTVKSEQLRERINKATVELRTLHLVLPVGRRKGTLDMYLTSYKRWCITSIEVDRTLRGHGVGTKLMRTAIEKAWSIKSVPIELFASAEHSDNQSRLEKWYASLGFKPMNKDQQAMVLKPPAKGTLKELLGEKYMNPCAFGHE